MPIFKLVVVNSKGEDVCGNFLNTDGAVAADYLSFIEGVIEELSSEKADLEKEANQSGKTIDHSFFESLGTINISGDRQ